MDVSTTELLDRLWAFAAPSLPLIFASLRVLELCCVHDVFKVKEKKKKKLTGFILNYGKYTSDYFGPNQN